MGIFKVCIQVKNCQNTNIEMLFKIYHENMNTECTYFLTMDHLALELCLCKDHQIIAKNAVLLKLNIGLHSHVDKHILM